MKVMVATSSLELGVVPPPPPIIYELCFGICLRNLNEVLAFCLCELGLSCRLWCLVFLTR
jgi:hypothetical protein